jgi:TonB family protein
MMDVVKRALPFLLTLIVGVFLGSLFKPVAQRQLYSVRSFDSYNNYGYHRRECPKQRYNHESYSQSQTYTVNVSPVILSKPSAAYTDAARENEFEGTVRLRVEFLVNGKVGDINVIEGQPYGLTAEAVKAAKQIRFRPALEDGSYVTKTEIVEYSFRLTREF